jgi:hypothetical protein
MRQIIWTNFAISELKNIYLYYRMITTDKVADKYENQFLTEQSH